MGVALSRDLGGWTAARPPGKAYPKEERTVSQARLGALSWPVGPWHAAGPIRKSRSRSVCFPAGATSLFPRLCSIHSSGSRARLAGGRAGSLCHGPGARQAPALASASVVAGAPEPACRIAPTRPGGCWWPSRVGRRGDPQGRVPDCFLLG